MPAPSGIPAPPANANRSFTGALVAGGRSTRMGCDKAALVLGGEPLWQRQLATLRTAGLNSVLISGRVNGPYAGAMNATIVEDRTPDAGPLGALDAVLAATVTPFVVVLGIDLPDMRAEFLQRLMRRALASGRSVIPVADERFEPLAAVYARTAQPLVAVHLRGVDRSMQSVIRAAEARGLVEICALSADERRLFRNLNSPKDLE